MRPLRILITNHGLEHRAGSELYVRDLALGLLRRGHLPIAYSSQLGPVADELRRATVPVVQHLAAVGEPPDVIHGQHHIETMTALWHFPQTPAIFFCHGWLPWEELPPKFPRIEQYLAVDDVCRDRLIYEHGVAAERVTVLLNFVDLDRFRPRPPLPPRPARAIVFSNAAGDDTYVRAIRAACAPRDIALDVVGLRSGNVTSTPELVLREYDLAFAKGRAALEAAATGLAVILCDHAGLGPLVTPAAFPRLRRLNFGIRSLQRPIAAEYVAEEIARYDAHDAAEVCRQLRAQASLATVLDALESIYRDAMAAHAARGPIDASRREAEMRAASEYLRSVSPAVQHLAHPELHRQLAELATAQEATRAAERQSALEAARLSAAYRELEQRYQSQRRELQSLRRPWWRQLRFKLASLPLVGPLGRAALQALRRSSSHTESPS